MKNNVKNIKGIKYQKYDSKYSDLLPPVFIKIDFNKTKIIVDKTNPTIPTINESDKNPLWLFFSFLKYVKSRVAAELNPKLPNWANIAEYATKIFNNPISSVLKYSGNNKPVVKKPITTPIYEYMVPLILCLIIIPNSILN